MARVFGIILLSLAIVLGFVASFAAMGEAWREDNVNGDTVRTTETYSLWTRERSIEADQTTTGESSWFDAARDDSAGITYLRAAPVLITVGLVMAVVALILTAVPRTSPGITGGAFGLLGFLGLAAGLLLHVLGARLRAESIIGAPDTITYTLGTYAAIIAAVLLLVAGIMGMRRTAPYVNRAGVPAHTRVPAEARITRPMACPRCSGVQAVPLGTRPRCGHCGYN